MMDVHGLRPVWVGTDYEPKGRLYPIRFWETSAPYRAGVGFGVRRHGVGYAFGLCWRQRNVTSELSALGGQDLPDRPEEIRWWGTDDEDREAWQAEYNRQLREQAHALQTEQAERVLLQPWPGLPPDEDHDDRRPPELGVHDRR